MSRHGTTGMQPRAGKPRSTEKVLEQPCTAAWRKGRGHEIYVSGLGQGPLKYECRACGLKFEESP